MKVHEVEYGVNVVKGQVTGSDEQIKVAEDAIRDAMKIVFPKFVFRVNDITLWLEIADALAQIVSKDFPVEFYIDAEFEEVIKYNIKY